MERSSEEAQPALALILDCSWHSCGLDFLAANCSMFAMVLCLAHCVIEAALRYVMQPKYVPKWL